MRILYLYEEELPDISDLPVTDIPDNNPIDSTTDVLSDNNISPKTADTNINTDVARNNDDIKRLPPPPPPNRNDYDYRIVPYYIPVGTRNYYRYLDYDRIEKRDIIDRDFRFRDGSYGIFCRYNGITIKAGSKLNSRSNIITVNIDGEIFIKKMKDSDRAKRLTNRLIEVLYNEGEERLLMLLIKYKFN